MKGLGQGGAEKRTTKVTESVCLLTVHSLLRTNAYFDFIIPKTTLFLNYLLEGH